MLEKSLLVELETGLQARPAASFVQQASRYQSSVLVKKGEKTVNAKSIMGLMSLAIAYRESITIIIDGTDEETAMKQLSAFVSSPAPTL